MHFKKSVISKNQIPSIWCAILVTISIILSSSVEIRADRGSSIGCYRQNIYLRRVDVFAGTTDICIDNCEQLYFRYAVLDGNSCLCTHTLSEQMINPTECDRPCTENSEQMCGGSYVQSYYDTDVKVAGPVRNLRVKNRSESSILLQWQHPESQLSTSTDTSLTRYVIQANVIKTFSSIVLPPPPQWTVEKINPTQIEIVNLHPGTTYNISVTSESDENGLGGTNSTITDTEIGIPDPAPAEPKIVGRDGSKLTIVIPHVINNSGPVTSIHVVVLFVDSELSQTFDTNLLKSYNEAQENGTSYYITAEIQNENNSRQFIIGDGKNYGGYLNAPLPSDRHVHASLGVISKVGSVIKSRYADVTSHEQHDDRSKTVITENQADEDDSSLTTALIVACCFFGILLVLSIIGYVFLRYKMENRLQRLPSDHHELTLQGPIVEVENNGGYQPDEFTKRNFDQKLNDLLDHVEPDKRFARNTLTLDVNNVLAAGQFGDVIRGKLNGEPCQVHVISDDMEPLDQSQFLKDFELIQQVGNHNNVIRFFGICQTPDWLYLLFEHTQMSLKKLLIESRTPPNINPRRFSSLSEQFILQTLYDISVGMEFLAKGKFTHKKLCSHNVRLTNDETVKISCFGATPYDSHGKTIDISRWNAPEVLRFQYHSERSDVWSFACLMWECCSLGGTLYANINSNDLVARIKSGARPERIQFVFDDMNQLLLNCWQLEPSERPSFSELSHTLRQLLTSPDHVLSFDRREGFLLPYYLPLLEVHHI